MDIGNLGRVGTVGNHCIAIQNSSDNTTHVEWVVLGCILLGRECHRCRICYIGEDYTRRGRAYSTTNIVLTFYYTGRTSILRDNGNLTRSCTIRNSQCILRHTSNNTSDMEACDSNGSCQIYIDVADTVDALERQCTVGATNKASGIEGCAINTLTTSDIATKLDSIRSLQSEALEVEQAVVTTNIDCLWRIRRLNLRVYTVAVLGQSGFCINFSRKTTDIYCRCRRCRNNLAIVGVLRNGAVYLTCNTTNITDYAACTHTLW